MLKDGNENIHTNTIIMNYIQWVSDDGGGGWGITVGGVPVL